MANTEQLRNLPAVDELYQCAEMATVVTRFPRPQVIAWVRKAIDACRNVIIDGQDLNADAARQFILAHITKLVSFEDGRKLHNVINATGILLHTNLGRAPLADAAIQRMQECATASNVEMNLYTGKRNKRGECVADLLARLTGAEDAVIVNNCAAATMLTLQTIAAGREVIVSRGQLVEIGGGYRLPEVFAASGAILKEVGTTNRTYLRDYEEAINENTGALIRVHRSNFSLSGFVAEPDVVEMVEVGRKHGIPVIDDIGSGCMQSLSPFGLNEPGVPDSVAAGADLTLFSGDKLFGGPQAGLIVGKTKWTDLLRSSPMMRALRVDKVTLAALEATTEIHLNGQAENQIPLLQLLSTPPEEIRQRCERLMDMVDCTDDAFGIETTESVSQIGGGSVPGSQIESFGLQISCPDAERFASALRASRPAVVGRISDDYVILDLRTVSEKHLPNLATAITSAMETIKEA